MGPFGSFLGPWVLIQKDPPQASTLRGQEKERAKESRLSPERAKGPRPALQRQILQYNAVFLLLLLFLVGKSTGARLGSGAPGSRWQKKTAALTWIRELLCLCRSGRPRPSGRGFLPAG
jgi:hypothetical protein